MDRSKQQQSTRGPKSKLAQQPPDLFIALGQKSTSSGSRDTMDSKRPIIPVTSKVSSSSSSSSHIQPSTSKSDRKREGSSTSHSLTASKKHKTSIPERPTPVVEPWESMVIECEPHELMDHVVNCVRNGNTERAASYLLGAIKMLRGQRFRPCKVLSNGVLFACQCIPSLFTNENVVAALVGSLRKDVSVGMKSSIKNNIYLSTMFVNLLTRAFADVVNWPEIFVRLYVEDAVAERVWIDNPYCKPFVDNIVTAFNTKQPPKSLLTSETWMPTGRDSSSPLTINSIDEEEALNEHKATVESWNLKVFPRFTQSQELVEQIVLEAIKEQLSRRQQPETKNFVRFLSTASGLVEIRHITVSKIENWLHNHKLMKPAQELLAYLCYNCSSSTQRELEVVAQLSKLRLKNKQMVNFFNNCLREMVQCSPENLYPLLKYTIYNELSNARNTNNLFLVGALFQAAPEPSADAFANICLELLLNKEDYLRSLRALLKEINRVLRHDFNLFSIVHALLRERKELASGIRDSEHRDRIFLSVADLACMCMLLCVSPQVRDAASQSKRDVNVLQAFQAQVSNIQREAVTWLHDSALRIYRPSVGDFHHVLLKVLFLEQAEHYYKVDSWPGENERNIFLRLASEVPLLQGTLLRVLLIGISKEHPIGPNEVIEIADQLIRRAANLAQDCMPPLAMDKIEIVDFFFNLCSYNYPENIVLPTGYVPPKLAISALYWKTWLILLILAAHNPATIGSVAWNKYPMLRMFMEMCITNHFSFPPPTMSGETNEDYQSKEQQILAMEKQKILEFESHLAAASTKIEITEHTSLLLPQLMELRPQGEPRRPPQPILDQLQALNISHRMGHLLCRSRNPDFLLNIMSRQGGTAHMPWLAELVHSSEGALAHLPVQCLCEYLLSTAPTERLSKHGQLLGHLRTVVNGPHPINACEVLEYLLRRMTSLHASSREQAIKGLTLILSPNEEVDVAGVNVGNTVWLSEYLPKFLHLNAVKPILIQFLRQALLVETNPVHVANYINFLATQGIDDSPSDLLELILDISSLIVERSSVTSYILPGDNMRTLRSLIDLFDLYLKRCREMSEESVPWSENQDQIYVTWSTGEQCTLQVLIVHASIILLTYGPVENCKQFDSLLDLWFPLNAEQPKAFLVDTQEEALLVPDWLKLRMIRSAVSRLVDAAVEKLEASQLVLFIQSFGIPVVSISKLLQTLDKVTLIDPKLVIDSVLDKNYMIQLVEVQNRRGAVGGETFVKVLEMQMPIIPDDEVKVAVETKKELPPLLLKKVKVEKNCEQLLVTFFSSDCNADEGAKIFRQLSKAVCSDQQAIRATFTFLQSLPQSQISSLLQTNTYILPFLRLIFIQKNYSDKSLKAAQHLLKNISSNEATLASILKHFLESNVKKMEVDGVEEKQMTTQEEDIGVKLGKLLLENGGEIEDTRLVVDWLNAAELEIVNLKHKQLQMDLLFSRKQLPFRPLLMSLVLQKASWSTLHGIVVFLLEGEIEKHCPISALDFLMALTQSPKLWQGRDKGTPKHHHSEDVLCLNKNQVINLTKYILEESIITTENWEKAIEARLPLLLKTISDNSKDVAEWLLQETSTKPKAALLLLMLYMSIPAIGRYLKDTTKTDQFSEAIFTQTTTAGTIDVVSHTLLSALGATTRAKDWTRKSHDLEILARKLAATHPELVLRQLPMLAGSLRGRAQYEWGVLKSRGHLLFFGQVLGLLELLQPRVFLRYDTLGDVLDEYFLLLKVHGHMKDLATIVNRVVVFLQEWMMKDLEKALKYLHKHGSTLNELQISQPSVRPLLSSVSLPSADHGSELLVGAATPPVQDPLPPMWPKLVGALQTPDNLQALQEVEHLTSKRPQLLQEVAQSLFNSMESPSQSVRNLAASLVVKLLRHNPKMASEALAPILSCLNSKNPDVILTILDRLPELVASMQEYAKIILTRVFLLENNSSVIASSISKTMAMLNLQSGC